MKPTHETARLTICLLGPTLIRLDQENVTAFGTDKARALLAYLAVEADRPHRRERLAGLLWPVRPERVARTNLRRALADLRRAIGDRETAPPFLHVKRGTIQFNNASDAWTDVTAFKQLLQIASSDRLIGLEAIQPLAEAVGLYRGAFLEGLSISDSAAFEEWALLQQEWLQREALTALSRLAGYYEELGDCESALPYAWRAANLDPWQEEARRRLMRLLTLSGQRAAALAQYEDCRRALIEELGVEPEEETTALYQQIRAQEFRPAATQPRVVPHNLRTPLTPFVGRETELTAIHARLNDPTCRLLTLIGPGGIGKTRVAVQVARDVASAPLRQTTFRDGVFFVPLVSVNPMGTVIPAIASALDLSFSGEINPELRWRDTGGLEDRLFNYLRAKQMLLVLDSFEHLLAPSAMPTSPPRVVAKPGRERDSVALITEILRAAPGVKILVTSREVLDLQPEWVYPLQGMDYPAVDGVPDEAVRLALEDYSAVALFAQCARRVCPAFSLAQAGEIAIRICQLVGGMPLAIELAASWLRHLSPDRIVAELERGLDILTTSWRDVPPRHRSVRAVFDYSWDLLSDKERCALQRLSVFRGGFGLQASEAVAGVSLPELGKLTEKSLLHASASERYEMHELFRQYCLEKLREDCSEEERTRDRHSDYYARFIQARGDALKGPHQKAAVVKMEIEIEDANVAWNWAAEHGHIERLDRMLEGMGLFYSWSSRAREGTVACQLAAEKITALISSHEPVLSTGHSRAEGLRVLARILAWQATLCSPDRAALAEQLLKRSLDLLEQAALDLEDTRSERAFVLLQMGQVAFATDLRRARAFYLDSLALYRMLDEQWWTARALQHLGWLAAYAGTYEESTRWHEESLAIRRGLGDARGIAESLKGLGTVLIVHGRPEQAEGMLRECVAIWRELGDRVGIAGGLNQLGAALIGWDQLADAFAYLREALAICRDLGLRGGEAWAIFWLGFAELNLGRYEQAQARGEAVLALARERGDPVYTGRSLWLLGDVALATGAYAKAESLLQRSAADYREYGLPNELIWVFADLAVAAHRMGQLDLSKQHRDEALRMFIKTRAVLSVGRVLGAAALLLADAGETERAVEVYALALRHAAVKKSCWFDDIFGRHIAAVAATLPADIVAAAQERGRARNLDVTVAELLVELDTEARDG